MDDVSSLRQAFIHSRVQTHLLTQEYKEVRYMQTLLWVPKVVVFPPPSSSVCVVGECVWPRSGSRTDGWAEGLAEVSSSFYLPYLLPPPPVVLLFWLKKPSSTLRGKHDKPEHNTTHCSFVMCKFRVRLCESKRCDL